MSNTKAFNIQGYLNFPRQKLSDAQKTDDWYKQNIDFAENLLSTSTNLRSSFKNKKINYDLASNIINHKDFERIINPDKLDLKTMPATFQHVGIENNKINLLLGEYTKRKKDFRVYLSSRDSEGISRKEKGLMDNVNNKLVELIKKQDLSEEQIVKELEELQRYNSYEYQDIAEIAANKILKKESKEQNFDFEFNRTFEDLLRAGEEVAYCGVLGRQAVLRRVNPMNLYTIGGASMFIEDSDIIVEFGYKSVGQIIDDYWDELTEEEIEFLETGKEFTKMSGGIGLNRDFSIAERFGEDIGIEILAPNQMGLRTFAGAFDAYGNVRELKVSWRSRRKIGELTYFDEDGQEQKEWVPETYVVNKNEGETIKWKWINEWLEGTKIGDHIYTKMRPNPYSAKSFLNKSKSTPSYIGLVNSTNDSPVISLTDICKPLSYTYDIAYYKRELAIATYKGSFVALNSSLIPSGWDPEKWMRYVTVNKFGWLDPTAEILKGPSQGKSAGNFNTVTAQSVQIGDANEIQMYTNLLLDIETTLGKVAGISGAREGQIQQREAVNNVERQVSQTSHITEKWFTLDATFRKRVLTKFLECAKYVYKKYPQKGQFILNDMEQVVVGEYTDIAEHEFDIHVPNSSDDAELFEDIRMLGQAAIQNGQAKIEDLIAIRQSDSTQEVSKKLEQSSKRISEEVQKQEMMKQEAAQKLKEFELQEKQIERDWQASENEKDRQLKREELEAKQSEFYLKEIGNEERDLRSYENQDTDKNGIDDYLDTRRVDIDERYKNEQIRLAESKLAEQIRSNKEKEKIAKIKKPTTT